ncbi:MAG: citramalate synthase [Sedimentisphaerales bacterium]|jgi:2-isopropylmalate synthase|nr:citramalate synthase [Sedimentisphaerales bacterium]NLT75298.1 citramalate synthase [Planctomycetota bacterium]
MTKIAIYDTTLRDGMQAEGVSFSLADKLAIAKCLNGLGVDYIEGGYAASNPKEMQFFHEVAKLGLESSKVTAFGSTRRADCTVEDDLSLNSILATKAPSATIVGKTWDLHVGLVLGCSLDENLAICAESIRYLKQKGLEAIFDAEHFFDGYQANPEYATKVLAAAAEAGADALVLCDTNGGSLPHQVLEITEQVCKAFGSVVVGIHTHNDSDCATANALAAIRAGARHVQGTINGLGERCGNANLCSLIPNLAFKMGLEPLSPDKIKLLTEASRFVFEVANLPPVMSLPYVGDSAFAHKAGLHVDALRKSKQTYEHIDPQVVGNERRFLISELSGKSNILAELEKAKIVQDKTLARKILARVQDLENEGYQFEAANASFDLLVRKIMETFQPSFELIKYHVDVEKRKGGEIVTEATVKLKVGDEIEHVVGEGDGPVNALDAALRKSLERFYPALKEVQLFDYKVRVVNAKEGTAARVRVVIESRDKQSIWGTVGVSENVIEASWLALVDSVEYKLQRLAG